VARQLSEYFGGDGILLPSPNSSNRHHAEASGEFDHIESWPLSIVYVSSDHDNAAMHTFARSEWFSLPWKGPERSDIKRHFRVGATDELDDLGLSVETRRMDIPALIILDAESRSLITANGVEDLHEFGDKALDRKSKIAYWR
jgi:Thioredoxin-like